MNDKTEELFQTFSLGKLETTVTCPYGGDHCHIKCGDADACDGGLTIAILDSSVAQQLGLCHFDILSFGHLESLRISRCLREESVHEALSMRYM